MRILIVNTLYYPAFRGGAEISVQLLAEELAAVGHNVYVICLGETTKVYSVNGVIVIRLKERNIYSTFHRKNHNPLLKIIWHVIDSFNIIHFFIFKKLVPRIKPELVNTNILQGISPIVWKVFKKNKIKVVHTIRDYYLLCHKSILFNNNKNCDKLCTACKITHSFKKPYFHIPDYFIGISQFTLDKYKSYGVIQNESKVVYNPIPDNIPVTYRKKAVNPDDIIFGYIGHISIDKGVQYLVDEITSVDTDIKKKIKIVFAGKGDERFVQRLADKLHNSAIGFDFIGVVKQEAYFSKINVSIVPSLWNEPFGRVAIEALAYSVPVCMSSRGGLRELYNPDCCWTFEPTKGELKKTIESISLNVPSILLKGNESKKYANQFSVSKNYLNTFEIFDNVMNQSKTAL